MNLRVGRHIIGYSNCFALPTVLISSIIMLAVLLSTAVMTTSTRVALKNQIYNMQARLANEAGEVYAKACLDKYGGISKWTNDKPLKSSTDCTGTTFTDITCPTDTICSISSNNSDKEKTMFSIGVKESPPPNQWKTITTGNNYSCAISNEDKVYCWGANGSGKLGDGSTTNRRIPTAVNADGVLSGKIIASVSVGYSHTCVITTESTNNAYCWGNNSFGQLGINNQLESHVPVAVDTSGVLSGKKITAISVGNYHTCVITSEAVHNSYCWGRNSYGQIGDNTSGPNRLVPVSVYHTAGSKLDGKTVSIISSGQYHTCVMTNESINNTYCWGHNDFGQIGDNTHTDRLEPVPVQAGSALDGKTMTNISAGYNHTCVITNESIENAYCWGGNSVGQIGDNTSTERPAPKAVYSATGSLLDNEKVTAISTGYGLTCAITNEATNNTYCWGYNGYGGVGDGTSGSDRLAPVLVGSLLDGKTVTSISAGNDHSCAITNETTGDAYCWGRNNYGQIGDASTTTRLTPTKVNNTNAYVYDLAITSSTNLLKSDGSIWRQYNSVLRQNKSKQLLEYQIALSSISAGGYTTCGITTETINNAYCWGSNNYGEVGDNTSGSSRPSPVSVYYATDSALNGKTVSSISTNYVHSCAITSELYNNAYCWGENDYGSVGDNTSGTDRLAPVPVYTDSGSALENKTVSSISTGNRITCAITNETTNNTYCWGKNNYGQVGDNTSGTNRLAPVPVYTAPGSPLYGKEVTAISTGDQHACAITSEAANNAYCWGSNGYGQVGDNTSGNNRTAPVPVYVTPGSYLYGKTVKAISTGFMHTCAITTEATNNVYCWGGNYDGQVGDNTSGNYRAAPVPVYVTPGSYLYGKTATSISVGFWHTCAITTEATNNVYCWGSNYNGQIGDNTSGNNRLEPVPVYTAPGSPLYSKEATVISAGEYHTCAQADMRGYCWGSNSAGELGINSYSYSNIPVSLYRAESITRRYRY